MNFSELMSAVAGSGAVAIPKSWTQGRSTYGGLTAALCLRAVRGRYPELPPLRSVQVAFVGPAAGDVLVQATLLRAGKSATFVAADLSANGDLAARAALVFGAPRPSALNAALAPAPAANPAPECEAYIPLELSPRFQSQFDTRHVSGGRPGFGVDDPRLVVWSRHIDDAAGADVDAREAALLALTDVTPPAALPMLPALATVSSMTWQADFRQDPGVVDGPWRLLETACEAARDGYSTQRMRAWSEDGALLVSAQQCVAIFG
ncbi:MAG: thioesterase family protein [Parvularculaceae bacterium]